MGNFDVLKSMALTGKDIAMCVDVVEMKSNKLGGTIAIGVPREKFMDCVMNPEKFHFLLFIADKCQYEAIRKEQGD